MEKSPTWLIGVRHIAYSGGHMPVTVRRASQQLSVCLHGLTVSPFDKGDVVVMVFLKSPFAARKTSPARRHPRNAGEHTLLSHLSAEAPAPAAQLPDVRYWRSEFSSITISAFFFGAHLARTADAVLSCFRRRPPTRSHKPLPH